MDCNTQYQQNHNTNLEQQKIDNNPTLNHDYKYEYEYDYNNIDATVQVPEPATVTKEEYTDLTKAIQAFYSMKERILSLHKDSGNEGSRLTDQDCAELIFGVKQHMVSEMEKETEKLVISFKKTYEEMRDDRVPDEMIEVMLQVREKQTLELIDVLETL